MMYFRGDFKQSKNEADEDLLNKYFSNSHVLVVYRWFQRTKGFQGSDQNNGSAFLSRNHALGETNRGRFYGSVG